MISNFNVIVLVLATISLFLYGLRSFSDEIRHLNADKLRERLSMLSSNRIKGFLLGAIFTGVLQSSSAVTSITVALVDAGVLKFTQSLAVMLGSNVGTTTTAWLVTFKLNNIGPYFILLGTLISAMPIKAHLYGKTIFYFGFILFSLDLINDVLYNMRGNENFIYWITYDKPLIMNILIGMIATILVQSSSLVSGLIVLLSSQGLLDIHEGVAIIVGCNLGTTSTALISAIRMNQFAKRSAIANFLFNAVGLLIFIPLIPSLAQIVQNLDQRMEYQVAYAHLFFNLATALLFIPFINRLSRWLEPKNNLVPTSSSEQV
jgi:phosphate:Na+ symporter